MTAFPVPDKRCARHLLPESATRPPRRARQPGTNALVSRAFGDGGAWIRTRAGPVMSRGHGRARHGKERITYANLPRRQHASWRIFRAWRAWLLPTLLPGALSGLPTPPVGRQGRQVVRTPCSGAAWRHDALRLSGVTGRHSADRRVSCRVARWRRYREVVSELVPADPPAPRRRRARSAPRPLPLEDRRAVADAVERLADAIERDVLDAGPVTLAYLRGAAVGLRT